MVHLFVPPGDKELAAEAKLFTEKHILHRTVGLKLSSEDNGTLIARVSHP